MDGAVEDSEELSLFRQQWRRELGLSVPREPGEHGGEGGGLSGDAGRTPVSDGSRDGEATCKNGGIHHQEAGKDSEMNEEAAELYWMGVAAERSGDLQNASYPGFQQHPRPTTKGFGLGHCWKPGQAVQLVPDIESRVSRPAKGHQLPAGPEREMESKMGDLDTAFENMTFTGTVCQAERPYTGAHMSNLPSEVVSYILRWVVGAELDVWSLEQCSMVCHGFHSLARDPGLWRKICFRLWKDHPFSKFSGSWRDLFLQKPHLHFNGVYISKSSYVRQGEKSLDGYYKPYHTVVYYRYLRFFTDGSVMYHTSPEDPPTVVPKLCNKHKSESVLLGTYTVQDSQLSVDVTSLYSNMAASPRGRHGWSKPVITHEHKFHLELQLTRKNFTKLVWQDHYCHSLHRPTGRVQVTHFTVDYKYTPFLFSRVKSFTKNSQRILI